MISTFIAFTALIIAVGSLIFALAARARAKAAVVDTVLLNHVIDNAFGVIHNEEGWGILYDGRVISTGEDLKTAITAAVDEVTNRG